MPAKQIRRNIFWYKTTCKVLCKSLHEKVMERVEESIAH